MTLGARWRRCLDLSQREGRAQEPMSLDSVRAEFQTLAQEVDAVQLRLAALEDDEKKAVDAHDRTALDSAWLEHDRALEQLRALEQRREQARRDLVREAEVDIDRWRSKAEVRVQRWREEGVEVFQQLTASLDQIEVVLSELDESPQRRNQERQQLLDELSALRPADFAAELSEPQIEWTVSALDLEPIASRLADLASRCRRSESHLGTGESRW